MGFGISHYTAFQLASSFLYFLHPFYFFSIYSFVVSVLAAKKTLN